MIYNGKIGYEVYPRSTTHVAPLWRGNDAQHCRGNTGGQKISAKNKKISVQIYTDTNIEFFLKNSDVTF